MSTELRGKVMQTFWGSTNPNDPCIGQPAGVIVYDEFGHHVSVHDALEKFEGQNIRIVITRERKVRAG